ncbi:MAG: response regulator [Gemmatimonadetes bacterium]|nr:response regulator [Gemmatimonadota bacterium]
MLVHLRPAIETSARFVALNRQIERLYAEVRRRAQLEQERTALIEAERDAREEAERANRLKDEFLATVSHEMRTPLQAILGWVSLLRTQPEDGAIRAQGLEIIERQVDAQVRLTEDLLDTSRAMAGRLRLALEPVELEHLVREAVDSMRPTAEARQIRLDYLADTGPCTISGDPQRLHQIAWNLLSNAIKFTPKGGRVQVQLRRVNSHVELVVSDTGEGIAPDVLPYIFDRFRQADGTSTRRHGGLGLGLSIVRHLTELHGGMVLAESEGVGRGASFVVNLPLPLFRPQEALLPHGGDHRSTRSGTLASLRVLLVEDHDDSREMLETVLTLAGASVSAFAATDGALRAYEQEAFDLVISDLQMPGEDGFTFLRKLRDFERSSGRRTVPAVAVTAHAIQDGRRHALEAGYQAVLGKPVAPSELVALARSLHASSTPSSDAGARDAAPTSADGAATRTAAVRTDAADPTDTQTVA